MPHRDARGSTRRARRAGTARPRGAAPAHPRDPVTTATTDASRKCSWLEIAVSATFSDRVDELDAGQAVEQRRCVDRGQVVRARDARDRLTIAQRPGSERGRDRDGQLELVVAPVLATRRGDHDREVPAAGVDELAHHERSDPHRSTPVHVAAVVPGLVLAQGVQLDVARGEVVRAQALEVADPARRDSAERHGARMHEEVGAPGPGHLAPHQSERVAAHRAHGTDADDPAPRGRERELLAVHCPDTGATERRTARSRLRPEPRGGTGGFAGRCRSSPRCSRPRSARRSLAAARARWTPRSGPGRA